MSRQPDGGNHSWQQLVAEINSENTYSLAHHFEQSLEALRRDLLSKSRRKGIVYDSGRLGAKGNGPVMGLMPKRSHSGRVPVRRGASQVGGAESELFEDVSLPKELVCIEARAARDNYYESPYLLLAQHGVRSPYIDFPIAFGSGISDEDFEALRTSGKQDSFSVTLPYKISKRAAGDANDISEKLRANSKESIFDYHVNFLNQMLRALAALHAKNIVHRDVKPDNILVYEFELAGDLSKILFKLTDLNFLSETKADSNGLLVDDASIKCTPLYLPYALAEKLWSVKKKQKPTELHNLNFKAIDLYSLGFSALELLFNCLPKADNDTLVEKFSALPEVAKYLGSTSGNSADDIDNADDVNEAASAAAAAAVSTPAANDQYPVQLRTAMQKFPLILLEQLKSFYPDMQQDQTTYNFTELFELIENLIKLGCQFSDEVMLQGDTMANSFLAHPVFGRARVKHHSAHETIGDYVVDLSALHVGSEPAIQSEARSNEEEERLRERERDRLFYQLPEEFKNIFRMYESLKSKIKGFDSDLVPSNSDIIFIRKNVAALRHAISLFCPEYAFIGDKERHPVAKALAKQVMPQLGKILNFKILKITQLNPKKDDTLLAVLIAEMLEKGEEMLAKIKEYEEKKFKGPYPPFHDCKVATGVIKYFQEALQKLLTRFNYKPKSQTFASNELTFDAKWRLLIDLLKCETWSVRGDIRRHDMVTFESRLLFNELNQELVNNILRVAGSSHITLCQICMAYKRVCAGCFASELYETQEVHGELDFCFRLDRLLGLEDEAQAQAGPAKLSAK